MTKTDQALFDHDACLVAPRLIGAELTFGGVGGIIVETEAYQGDDPASHSFIGMRPRNRTMFGSPGLAYVYRSYGMHWCLNVVCKSGDAVLIRALEPTLQIDLMQSRRGRSDLRLLCAGPGRLCQALAIGIEQDGQDFLAPPFQLVLPPQQPEISISTRIGITKAADRLWRFGLKGSAFVSRKFPQ